MYYSILQYKFYIVITYINRELMDYSLHLKNVHCKSGQMNYCVGPTGPTGPAGTVDIQEAILFFQDISSGDAFESELNFDYTTTINNGLYNWMDGSSNSSNITFSNMASSTAFVELYTHCDATAGNNGSDNYIFFDLSAVSHNTNSLGIVDIDTRSVAKGDQAHLSFGPSAYKVMTPTTSNNSLVIHKNNTYRLKVKTGREYALSEVKLIIKLRNL